MIVFDEIEADALKEVFNIGVGYAADSLSRMVNEEVRLSVPRLRLVERLDTLDALDLPSHSNYCAVTQRFEGDFNAEAVLMFPGEKSLELVRMMVGETVHVSEMNELEQEALTEVGNILLNSCVAVIADMLGHRFRCSLPRYKAGQWRELLPEPGQEEQCVLVLDIDFAIERRDIQGFLIFFMKVESLDEFRRAILSYLERF